MLPSTGYFKGINCPFYDSGLCERPYCHFRHSKKESQNVNGDGIESGTILQKLVSAAVQKVLQQTEPPVSKASSNNVDTNIVNNVSQNIVQTLPKATYNPTPISELNKLNTPDSENNEDINDQRKRHIPVPYTPRKPTSLPIKRPVENEEALKPFIFIPPAVKYKPGCTNTAPLDQYTPKGTSESNNVYIPGTDVELQEYAPKEIHSVNKINYIPSEKNSTNKKKILEYKPSKVTLTQGSSSVTYQPTPRFLAPCFSSDEDEPDTKKQKVSDLNGLDDLGPEFDILDQILDEEKSNQELTVIKKKKESSELEIKNKEERNDSNNKESDKVRSNKENKEKDEKRQSNKKEKYKNHKDNKKHEKYNSKSEKPSTNKSDHKNKHKKDERIEKHKLDKKSQSSSKSDSKYDKTKSKDHKKKSDRHSSSKNGSKDKKDTKSSKSNSKSKHKSKDKVFTHNKIDNDNDSESLLQNEVLSESDEESIAMECKKIFEEYVPTEKVDDVEDKVDQTIEDNSESEYVPGKVRISRTANKNIKTLPKPASKPNHKAIAAQTMAERLSKIKDYHSSKNSLNSISNENTTNKLDNSRNLFNTPSNSKIRIAHVPYASTLLNAKKGISPNINEVKSTPSTSSTIIQSVKKGSQRIAHIPNEKFIDRPGVLEPLASKIPPNIRSTYLNMMIDECLKIYLSATDAYARAQHEELSTSKKCTSVNIYKNSAVLAVSRLRKELQECKGVKKSGTDFSTLKKNSSDTLPKSCNGSWSIEHKKYSDNTTEFKGAKFYQNIAKWILSEEELRENGFPRPHSNGEKGRALIYVQKKQIPPKGYVRTCCRCKKNFTVDKKGLPVVKEDCIYHPNNKYRLRGEVKYQCCSQDGMSDGCCTASTHVYEYIDYDNLKGFVRTLPPETEMDDYGIYSLDCEMCYTTHGLDLTRITVINSDCKVVYETLIKPLHPIIDYNTRYSGITEDHMKKVKTTLLEVQATLLTLFNSKTILVGHSLESDFKALKLIHDTVVDTSVLFPHKMGPPYKRALRNLSSEHLRKIIQNSVDGHDSAEDATVCMELLHYKLREYLKTR